MTTRTRKTAAKKDTRPVPAETGAPAKKKPAKRAPAPRKTAAKKTALTLVQDRKPLPVRDHDYMTDVQGHATLAARIVGITTPHIPQWVDHHDGTATRRLIDGTLHYDDTTRTLSWQATCLMGAVHTYPIPTPSAAAQARVLAARCEQLHADLTKVPALTRDELEALGIHTGPTWARPDVLGEEITQTITVPVTAPEPEPRALGDELTRSASATDETHPMSLTAIAEGLAARTASVDTEPAKEHPQP